MGRAGFHGHALKCDRGAPSRLHLGTGAELGPRALNSNGADTRGPELRPQLPGTLAPFSPRQPLASPDDGLLPKPPFSTPAPGREGPEGEPALAASSRSGGPTGRAGNLCPDESLKSIFSARHPSPASEAGGRAGRGTPPRPRQTCVPRVFASRAGCTPSSPAPPAPEARLLPLRPSPAGRRGPTWAGKRSCCEWPGSWRRW